MYVWHFLNTFIFFNILKYESNFELQFWILLNFVKKYKNRR
jgi:hypothetical protein